MPITQFDSTNPAAVPDTAEQIAIYIDGLYRQAWADALAAGRFANTPKRRIACVTVTTPSDTGDFERYDLTPADGPVWWRNMTALGEVNLWAYCNRSNRVAVEDAMWGAGIRDLSMWIATLDGTQVVAPYRYPIAAVQYTDTGSVDLSVVYQTFGPGGGTIGGGFMAALTDAQQLQMYDLVGRIAYALKLTGAGLVPGEALEPAAQTTSAILVDIDSKVSGSGGGSTPEPPEPAEPKTITLTIPSVPGTATGTIS